MHRTKRVVRAALAGALLLVAACGGDESTLEPGQVDFAASTTAPLANAANAAGDTPDALAPGGLAPDAPGYCDELGEIIELTGSDLNNEEFLSVMVGLSEAVAEDGPEEFKNEYSLLAESLRGMDSVLRTHGYETDLDTVELTDDESGQLLLAGLALANLGDIAEVSFPVMSDECGFDPGAMVFQGGPIAPGNAQVEPGASPSVPEEAENLVQVEEFAGPFGSASHGHVLFEITNVALSNADFRSWGSDSLSLDDPDATNLFVRLAITNNDPNNNNNVPETDLVLLVDGEPVGSADRVNIDDFGPHVNAQASVDRDYAWVLDGPVTADQLALRYGGTTVPVVIPFVEQAVADSAYPMSLEVGSSGSYPNGIACDEFEWTIEVDSITYLVDAPPEIDFGPGFAPNRATSGERYLLVDGVVTTSDAPSCLSATGIVNRSYLRLVIDGRPIEPIEAPNQALMEAEALELSLLWAVPVDVEELALRAIGYEGDSVDVPLPVPELPLVNGG